jgi:pentatricopeptide repeat protein
MDIPDVYGEIADAYFDKKLWEDALEVYREMTENEEVGLCIAAGACMLDGAQPTDKKNAYTRLFQH